MDTKTFAELMEAYQAVYDDEMREEYLQEDYSFIDGLDDEEIADVVEEVIYELIDEGYDVDEVEALFEDTFITEAKVTMGRGGEAGEGKVTTGTGSRRLLKRELLLESLLREKKERRKLRVLQRVFFLELRKV